MEKEIIQTDRAPAAIGAYSQAVKAGGFIFVSGQIPIDPTTGHLVTGDIRHQTHRALRNIEEILRAAGCTLDNVVKTTVYIRDIKEYALVNEVYSQFFSGSKPARACVEVSRLPKEAKIEIDVVAVKP
jgi:2-iminobutanoate/2-iminopropanoate deaminase